MRINKGKLARWQQLDAVEVVSAVADHAKEDGTFKPLKDPGTSRWHISANGQDFELLLTGPKFWDNRARCGGGGAVDLVIHLFALEFKGAAKKLQDHRL